MFLLPEVLSAPTCAFDGNVLKINVSNCRKNLCLCIHQSAHVLHVRHIRKSKANAALVLWYHLKISASGLLPMVQRVIESV